MSIVMDCKCGARVEAQGYGVVKCPACKTHMGDIPYPVDDDTVREPTQVVWEAMNGKKFADQVVGDPGVWVGKYRRIDILNGMDVRIKIRAYTLS